MYCVRYEWKWDDLPWPVFAHTTETFSAFEKKSNGEKRWYFAPVRSHPSCRHCMPFLQPSWRNRREEKKRVMWDWRLKYFINQCCSQCVVLWLVEDSGNPSFFLPGTGHSGFLSGAPPCYSFLSWFPGLTCVVGVGAVERATCTMPSPVISVSVTCMLPL